MNIGVIYNSFCYKTPLPEEAEMRATALAIGSYLSRMGYQVQYFDMDTPAAVEALCASHLDAAFNACERVHDSARGEIYAAGASRWVSARCALRQSSATTIFQRRAIRFLSAPIRRWTAA
jgi:hypothetical protein